MILTETFNCESVAILAMAVRPTPDEPLVQLIVELDLTPDMAEALGCQAAVFTEDGQVRDGFRAIDLDATITQVRLTVRSAKEDGTTIICHPEIIDHLKVLRSDTGEPRLRMRVKNTGYAAGFCDLLNESHEDWISAKLEPEQMSIDFSGPSSRAGASLSKTAHDENFMAEIGIADPPEETTPAPKKRRKKSADDDQAKP